MILVVHSQHFSPVLFTCPCSALILSELSFVFLLLELLLQGFHGDFTLV